MAVLILAGLAVVGYTLMSQSGKKTAPPPPAEATPPMVGALSVVLNEPAGTTIASLTPLGGTILLHLVGGGLPARVVIVDLASGQVRGRISLSVP